MKIKTIKKIETTFYYILKAVMALGLAYALVRQEWLTAIAIIAIFFMTYIPTILSKKYRVYLPAMFDIYIATLIFFGIFLGEIYDYYETIWWWDLYLHTEAGALLGMIGFVLIYVLNASKDVDLYVKPGFMAFFAFTFAMAGGVVWEIFEFGMDSFLGLNMQKSGIVDTMWDLIVNGIGAIFTSVLGFFWLKKSIKFIIFDRSISRFITKNTSLFKKMNSL